MRQKHGLVVAIAVLVGLPTTSYSQSPASSASPEFEVASFKRNHGGGFEGEFFVSPSGLVRSTNTPVAAFIFQAYRFESLREIVGLPSWTESEFYDLVAKGPAGLTPAERQQMWQALLRDRMKLAAHYESREEPVYNLVFARADQQLGPQLTRSRAECTSPKAAVDQAPAAPVVPENVKKCVTTIGGTNVTSDGMTMEVLSSIISRAVGRPVKDRTGLTGLFSVRLAYVSPLDSGSSPTVTEGASVFTALREQLGLMLEPDTSSVRVVVIDHIERPSAN